MNFTRRIITLMLALALSVGTLSITASAAGTTMYGIGFVNASSLRLRSEANTASSIIDTASSNECVVIISRSGEWYKVNYNLQVGYMHEDYLDMSTCENAELGYGKIIGNGVNLRSGPATSYSVSAVSAYGNKCYIIGLNEGWYKVIYNGKICYIRSDFVELTEIPYENKESANAPKYFRRGRSIGATPGATVVQNNTASSGSAIPSNNAAAPAASGAQILAEAQKYLGTRYLSGGTSPNGFDCAGLVYYVLKQVGCSPYRTPSSQYQMGTYVDKANLKAGDIVFFAGTGASGISHVGIYAGNGQFIHAPNSRSTVSYSSLTSGYWAEHYYGARRMS